MSFISSLIEFKRFILVGAISTFINYFSFYLCLNLQIFEYLASAAFGYIAGTLVGYTLNNKWTFSSNGTGDLYKVYKYFFVYFLTLIASLVLLEYFVTYLNIIAEVANIICIIFTTLTNFFLIKFFVFKKI
jgi:putative flippase GtrA